MNSHGRRNGDGASYPIPLWSGILEHRERIGAAIWEFIWCLDKITVERDGVGLVLGGQPIKAAMISVQIGKSERWTREGLEHLEKAGYIRRRRTPVGHVIEVLNSHKFGIWKRTGVTAENVLSNKDTAVRDAAETQQQPAAPPACSNLDPWKAIGLDRPVGDFKFRELWESTWIGRNGHPLSQLVGDCADSWQAARGKVPGPFFARLAAIREQERSRPRTAPTVSRIPTVSDIVPKER